MCSFDSYIDFNDFGEFESIDQNKSTIIATSNKIISPSKKYIFKFFQFECYNSKDQKVFLDTFYQISKKKNQYLQSYKYISLSYKIKLTPVFSMKCISSNTLEEVLRKPELLSRLAIKNIMQCIFAVAEGMSYLHNHLICHGNLCPSNIIIDDANQFYLSDFGLYPIKKLYMDEKNIFNNDYKDPSMKNKRPTFMNDIYSYGILICDICIEYSKVKNKLKKDETVKNYLQNSNKQIFDLFPFFCTELIAACTNPFFTERPSFNQIIDKFKTLNENFLGIDVQKLYNEFKNSNYYLNLASKNDPIAQNKVGKMYEYGKILEKDYSKALEFYEKSANMNYSEAQNNFGVLLQKLSKDNPNELIKGAHYLQLSAEQGNIHGMANYGYALLKGKGVEQNMQKAGEYLRKSADLGDSFAQLNYGRMLLNDNQMFSGINKGLNYIKQSINKKNPKAYYTFGILLQQGKYVEKNSNLAIEYIKVAAEMGYKKAINELYSINSNKQIININAGLAKATPKKFSNIENEKKEIHNESLNSNNSLINQNSKTSNKFKSILSCSKNENDLQINISNSSDEYNELQKNPKDELHDEEEKLENVLKTSKRYLRYEKYLNKSFPLKITSKIKLISLGKIVYDRINYHTINHIYPVGYQVQKQFYSINNPNEQATYLESVLDGGALPIFRVECLDKTRKVFEGNSPTTPWREILTEVAKLKNDLHQEIGISGFSTKISGPAAFGFSTKIITFLIERLPNADKCILYKFKTFCKKNDINDENIENEVEEESSENIENEVEEESSEKSEDVNVIEEENNDNDINQQSHDSYSLVSTSDGEDILNL